MIQQCDCSPPADPPHFLTLFHWRALRLLNEALLAAHSEGQDIWQFAVDIDQLRALGLSCTDLRCLICWDYLQHAQERTAARTRQRIFQPLKALVLPKRTCFVLTAKGRDAISASYADMMLRDSLSTAEQIVSPRPVAKTPRWDSDGRQLWWGTRLIKEFRRPATNQELVLAALEEEGWPVRIDDPLSPIGDIDTKVRLHDTIKGLNHHHLHRIIHFGGDGTGRGIVWILLKQD